MKRHTVVLILVVVGMLIAAAPASAVTLHGQWTGGVANGTPGSVPEWGLQWGATETLGAGGLVNITTYPMSTDVASLMIITADPGVPPFPVKVNTQAFFAWGPASVHSGASGAIYTVHGSIKSPMYTRAGLIWSAVLVADTGTHDLTVTITTTGSYWGWQTWTLYGELY